MQSINTFTLNALTKYYTKTLMTIILAVMHFWCAAQCISSIYCPVGPDTFCQHEKNDPLFWKASYWKDTIQGANDLFEMPVDLNISVRNNCGSSDQLTVRYQLYLDLNQDGTEETVIDSDQPVQGDTVYFGNALTPNAGLPYRFDFRPVTPVWRYRFALQKQVNGDTLRAALRWHTSGKPQEYVLPKLPGQGKSRIVWTIQKGTETLRCERVFQVRDCEKPQVECYQGLSGNIDILGSTFIWANDFFKFATENITPINQLEWSIRKKGQGNGFPLDQNGKPINSVSFVCKELGKQELEVWVRDKAGNTGFCLPIFEVQDPFKNCSTYFYGFIKMITFKNTPIPDVEIKLIAKSYTGNYPIRHDLISDKDGNASVSKIVILNRDSSKVTPYHNQNPLNGVSTYDLVLISKHILGLESISDPYLLLAADANNSNSVTTLDIVELRKLILGIYTTLPDNTSWRFIPRSLGFLSMSNPFTTPIPECIHVGYPMTSWTAEFVGIKIGDVNGTTAKIWDDGLSEDRAAPISIQVPDLQLQTGEILEIPLHLNAETALNGFQFDLQFDPQLIDVQGIMPQNIQNFSAENYSRSVDGSLRVSWADARAQAGATLVLRLRALAPVRLSEALAFADQSIRAEAYSSDNAIHPLHLQFAKEAAIESLHIGEPWPNPSATGFTFDLQSNDNEQLNLQISDLSGRVAYQISREMSPGASTLTVPASALPQAGVYGWRVQLGSHFKGGKLVVK